MIGWGVAAALGSVLGSLARYALSLVVPVPHGFPLATLTVNLAGALAIGVVAQRPQVMQRDLARHFVVTGVLGGFTTFSALALDTVNLVQRHPSAAVGYVMITLIGGLAATHVGWRVAQR
jgi:CrcB protein